MADTLVGDDMTGNCLPERGIPGAKIMAHQVVFLGNRMCAEDDIDSESRLDKIPEETDPRAGRIADDQTGRQMDHVGPVADHLFRGILDVSAGAPVAGRVPHQACVLVTITAEGACPLPQRPEALSARATG